VAEWWGEFELDGPEIQYFQRFVEDGQPALDAGCGTGRLLVPWLRAGLDVDGCDASADMVTLCRERARREGWSRPSSFKRCTTSIRRGAIGRSRVRRLRPR